MKQLSIFLENTSGKLKRAYSLLGENNINIRALTIAETVDYGLLRVIVDNTELAYKILSEDSYKCSVNDVLGVELDDVPNALEGLLDTFLKHQINIDYVYGFTQRQSDKCLMAIRVEDYEGAFRILEREGFTLI